MRPPLMRDFMRGHVGHEIDGLITFRIIKILNESDAFRIRHGARERLGKARVTWKFKNTCLMKLIRRKFFTEHIERNFHRINHALHIVIVRWMVIHRKLNQFSTLMLPSIALHRIARGLH